MEPFFATLRTYPITIALVLFVLLVLILGLKVAIGISAFGAIAFGLWRLFLYGGDTSGPGS